jgi:hypothetical protein
MALRIGSYLSPPFNMRDEIQGRTREQEYGNPTQALSFFRKRSPAFALAIVRHGL